MAIFATSPAREHMGTEPVCAIRASGGLCAPTQPKGAGHFDQDILHRQPQGGWTPVSISVSSVVPSPIEEVFAWHERPGALARLLPPWQPVWVKHEATNLRDGRAQLSLPGGLVWVATHEDYDRPHRFVDRLSSLPLRWRHEHRFEPVGTTAPGWSTMLTPRCRRGAAGYVRLPAPSTGRGPFRTQLGTAAQPHSSDRRHHGCWRARRLRAVAFLSTGGHRVIRLVRRAPGGRRKSLGPGRPRP